MAQEKWNIIQWFVLVFGATVLLVFLSQEGSSEGQELKAFAIGIDQPESRGRRIPRAEREAQDTLCLKKKQDTKLLPITSPNVNRFSKFFHCQTHW